jgi:hypothetical protein
MTATMAVAAALLARPAHAQAGMTDNPHLLDPGSCVASIPDSALTTTAVYAVAATRSATPQRVPIVIANVLQAVVDRADSALGASPPYLPSAEPALNWHSLGAGLVLTWHRDGRLTWMVDSDSAPTAQRDPAALARLFGRSLDATVAAGEVYLAWPADVMTDSVQYDIGFARAPVSPQRKIEHVDATFAIPMLSVRAPWETSVGVVKAPAHVKYPWALEQRGVRATVLIDFVVDTTGVADPATIHDAWPPWRPRLTGQLGKYYDEFFAAAVKSLAGARFTPATIAGCKVRERVVQPFTWEVRN